ncbi:MAG TPA: hypothetical protein VJW76_15375, partial [Verrucomicrobiae bacterium]|nr:hypothetical protein [Verrucomicrobiae bacterium]
AFARASFGRLFLVQLIVAFLVGLSVAVVFATVWFPVIEKALTELPAGGAIRRGRLEWPGQAPVRLAEDAFLSIVVDPEGTRETGQSGDVQLELERNGVRIRSLVGDVTIPYPNDWTILLNHREAKAWWGAWRPFLLGGVVIAVVALLLAGWVLLTLLYAMPIGLVAFYSDRVVRWTGCLRMAGAAVLPGALVMSGATLLYGLHRLNLVGLLFAWVLHWVISWVYVCIAPLRLPRLTNARRRGDPFGAARPSRK